MRRRALAGAVAASLLVVLVPGVAGAAGWESACPPASLPPPAFEDVDRSAHRDEIACAAWYGLVNGKTATRYAPSVAVIRGEAASLLARLIEATGAELPPDDGPGFSDTDGNTHERAINQLAALEIVDGHRDGSFRPWDPVTRAQAATMLVGAVEYATGAALADGPDAFTDDDGSTHEPAIDAAAHAGLVEGTGPGRYRPSLDVGRAQVAVLLARSLGLLVEDGHAERLPEPAFHWEHGSVPADVRREMRGVSWHEGIGCPDLDELVLVELWHRGFDGRIHRGELVVARTVAADLRQVFGRLYAADFPLRRMQRVDAYGGDDDASMAADNTSAFNCRYVAGTTTLSQHSHGTAVDLNPVENPYVSGSGVVSPPAGERYTDRGNVRPGMIVEGDVVVEAFDAIGWGWGGRWDNSKDYQHFSSTGR